MSQTLLSISEAASMLGVSPSTLRSWDKSGKLRATRDPGNGYRHYSVADITTLQAKNPWKADTKPSTLSHSESSQNDANARRLIRSLSRIIRDEESDTSIISRFDEISKLIFCKLFSSAHEDLIHQAEAFESARGIRAQFAAAVALHPHLFPTQFCTIRLRDRTLERLASSLNSIDISSIRSNIKGLAYEELIKNTFDKSENQQFFTPRNIVSFMVELVADRLQGTICDPACGTGGFLVECARHLDASQSSAKLVGYEIDQRLAWASGINLTVNGASNFETRYLPGTGTLSHNFDDFETTDIIITNPPFGSDLTDQEALARLRLGNGRSSRRRGVLFVERCLQILKPGGILAMVIDDSVLNAPSTKDVRALIHSNAIVRTVVSLPDSAFMPYATVKTSILILEKRARKQQTLSRPTFYAEAEAVARRPNGETLFRALPTGEIEPDSDLPDILRAWRSGPGPEPYSEDPLCFWHTEGTDYDPTSRVDVRFHHPAKERMSRLLSTSPYNILTLAQICNIIEDTAVPAIELPDEEIDYIGLANIQAHSGVCNPASVLGATVKSASKRCVGGDLLLSKMRPELRKIARVPAHLEEAFSSAECIVLRANSGSDGRPIMDLDLLSAVLRSDLCYGQVLPHITGIGRPRVSKKVLMNIKIPVPTIAIQAELLSSLREQEAKRNTLLEEGMHALRRAKEVSEDSLRGVADALGGNC